MMTNGAILVVVAGALVSTSLAVRLAPAIPGNTSTSTHFSTPPISGERLTSTIIAPMARADAPAEARRIALLIGIADYQHFNADGPPGESDLRGPRTDVARMQHSLARFGFDDSLTTVLVDSQASRASIRQALIALSDKVQSANDVVVVYYSGHGTQVPDLDGDEDDGVDEALVPWDVVNIRDPHQVILDDSLGVWLGALRTRNVTVIVDACFSGTITRSLGEEHPRGAPPLASANARPRPMAPESSADAIGTVRRDLKEIPFTVLTAAAANELAVELPWPDLDNRYSGVFTYALTRLLDEAAGSAIRYDAFIGLVRDDVRRWTRQTPQLEGSADARASRLFSVARDSLPPPAAVALRAADGQWSVNIGAAHGVRRGTVFDVASSDAAPRKTIGQFLVDSVADDRAHIVRIGAPDSNTLAIERGVATISTMPPNARASESLRVYLSPGLRSLSAAMTRVAFARLTNDSATADVVLSPAGRGMGVAVRDVPIVPLPRWRYPSSSAYAEWVSDSADLVQASRPNEGYAFARSPSALCTALRRAWVASSIRSVVNPARNYNLSIDLRVVPAGSAPPNAAASTVDTLIEGESYDLLVRAISYTNAPIFLTTALAGQRGIPLTTLLPEVNVRAPAASDSVNLRSNGGWSRIRFGRATPPFAADFIALYLGAFPYSFSQLVAQTPTCAATATRSLERDPSVTGWTSTIRRIVFVPRPATEGAR